MLATQGAQSESNDYSLFEVLRFSQSHCMHSLHYAFLMLLAACSISAN